MADQNQSANVALTKNEILQNDLKKACELLGRYLLSNETLEAFMGPTHNRITITTDIVDNPDAENNKNVKQRVLTIACTRYTEEDTPVTIVNRFPISSYDQLSKYSYLLMQ